MFVEAARLLSMAAAGGSGCSHADAPTRRQSFSGVGCSVQECSLAVGEVEGYESVKSASRMNSAVVVFLDSTDKVNQLLESGIVIKGTFTPVSSLVNPAEKVIISNVPPLLKNELLEKELARHGQLMIPTSCSKSPHLKHVVSFRRQVFMVLKKRDEELNLVFRFKINDFDYIVHVSSDTMKCFGCGAEGHLIRWCPERAGGSRPAAEPLCRPSRRGTRRILRGKTGLTVIGKTRSWRVR